MKALKTYHVLLFLVGVFALLGPLMYFTPEGGWNLGGTSVQFMTYEQFIHPVKEKKANIDYIEKEDTAIAKENLLKYKNVGRGNLGAPSGSAIIVNSSTNLSMNEAGLANLEAFFSTMNELAAKKEKLGILHYGDSQIEGDRMTNFIRQRLQAQFGGFGPGLIPATNVYNTNSFYQTYSDNFERYTCFARAGLASNKYGALGSVSRFTSEKKPTKSELEKMSEKSAWIEIQASPKAYQRAQLFNTVSLHYTDCIAPVKLKVYHNGTLIHDDYLIPDSVYHVQKFVFDETPGKLKFEFIGKVSPNICGFGMEGDYGVQVSNVGMRGSSGLVFGKMNYADLKSMYTEVNARMIILQYGGNSIPFFTDSASVVRYARNFKSQINVIKRLIPNASVVVIGPSDMSDLVNGIRTTYKYLPYCIEQMRTASVEAGAAYWDLYAAMGGENSMPSWVDKGLAAKDYIHFSNDGAKYASQMFYEALISEFVKWKEKTE